MRVRSLALLCLAALFVSCAHASHYKPKGRPVPYQGWFATFPTGMRLVVYEMPHVDRFLLSISYRAGSVDDPPGKQGLAHLVEHLAFRTQPGGRGTPRLWEQLLATGWVFNAGTSPDHTAYWEAGKPPDLRQALALEADRMRDPLAGISEDDFAVERDVVVSEYRERFETNPMGSELQFLLDVAFPEGHPYRLPVAGNAESIRRATLSDARAFVQSRYQPAGAVMVVASPLPRRETVQLVASVFGPLADDKGAARPPLEWKPPTLPPTPEAQPPLVERRAPVEQPHLWVAWTAPGFFSRRTPQARATAAALEAAIYRKFAQEAFFQNVDGVFVFDLELDGATVIGARIDLRRPQDAERYLDLVKSAAFDLRRGELSGERASRAIAVDATRERLIVEAYQQLERVDTDGVARFLRATGNPDFLGMWPKLVTVELYTDIDSYAAEFLRRERAVAVLVRPDGNALASRGGASLSRRNDAVDELEVDSALQPPGPERALAAAVAPNLDRAERRVLPNGLQVIVSRRGTLPLAEVRVVVRMDAEGSEAVPAGLPGVALGSNVPRYVGRGQSQIGARWTLDQGREWIAYGASGSSGNLDVLLEGAAQRVRSQSVDHFDFRQRFARRWTERLEAIPSARAFRLLESRLFPGHPYGAVATSESIDKIKESQADRWSDGQFRPERSTLVVVSDLEPSPEMWAWIESEFGGWGRGSQPPAALAAPAPVPRRSVTLIDRPGATQALLLVGLQGAPSQADEPAAEAMRWVLQSRLLRRIRVAEGVSYGASVLARDFRLGQAVITATNVDGSAAGRSLAFVLESLGGLAERPLDPVTVARARWQVARRFGHRFDTVGEVADALEFSAARGLSLDRYEGMPASIATLDAGRIQAAARALSPGREVVVVVGDAKVVAPQLRQAGLDPEIVK